VCVCVCVCVCVFFFNRTGLLYQLSLIFHAAASCSHVLGRKRELPADTDGS